MPGNQGRRIKVEAGVIPRLSSKPLKNRVMETIFRKESDGEILAVFVDSVYWDFCECYAHVGQHGTCAIAYVINETTPATPEEMEPLCRELRGIGYELEILPDVPEWILRRSKRR